MKKFIAILILLSLAFSGGEAFAVTDAEDLTRKSGYSAKQLSAGLRKELLPLAEEFLSAEEKYGVNAVFLAAVAALESGWGEYCFRRNNIFGWSGKSFSSKEECIDFVARKIAENYLSPDGKYYRGKSVSAVNCCYNGLEIWDKKVREIMAMICRACGEPQNFAFSAQEGIVIG